MTGLHSGVRPAIINWKLNVLSFAALVYEDQFHCHLDISLAIQGLGPVQFEFHDNDKGGTVTATRQGQSEMWLLDVKTATFVLSEVDFNI